MVLSTSGKPNNNFNFPGGQRVMRISLVVSLGCHIFLFAAMQKAFPVSWIMKPLKTYHVELFRPAVHNLDEDETSTTELAGIKPKEKPKASDSEDTISLDTTDRRYSSYARVIKERLMRQWRYPPKARENLIEGEVLLVFSLNREGHLLVTNRLENAAHSILAGEAERAIRQAAPFPPFPHSITVSRLNIRASFIYRLTASKK
ncbi:MAG: TonB family protein [Desulfatiglans sp.]|jgi:TonB family protein|nr:TonB family protein [Thermodesulfobacteriota bacterium]MEE4354297.1 TonB family protein [Desulfatiglans sp.]